MKVVRKSKWLQVAALFSSAAVFHACTILPVSAADIDPPGPADRQTAFALTVLLESQHVSREKPNDKLAVRCYELFLKTLDPMKAYFTQADIDGFSPTQTQLDDMLRKGDTTFAFDVFKVYLQRVDERVAWVNEFLAAEHDFTLDEELVVDPKVAKYATNEEEARDMWRRRVKFELLNKKAEKITGQQAQEEILRKYTANAKRYHQFDKDELLEIYLSAFTSAYDPHTNYMSHRSLENFEIQMRLELEGIGAQLGATDGFTQVARIIPGGAADRAGELKVGDRLLGVAQADADFVDTSDMKLPDVVDMVRGKRGTVVRLKVASNAEAEPRIISITRDRIELKDSEARGEVIPTELRRHPDGSPYKIGVIDLPSFYMDMDGARSGLPNYKSTTRDCRALLEGFKQQGVDAVILDLRRNGGGSLTEAINLTGLFINEGPVVQVKDSAKQVETYFDTERGVTWDGPLVVLTSRMSASASEILAGAIQDYRRGLVVGDISTHGKGTVQSLIDVGERLMFRNQPNLGALKVTIQQFYRPNGDSTQNRGVESDVALPSITDHLRGIRESDLDYALEFSNVTPATYSATDYVDRTVVSQLRELSKQRLDQSDEFKRVQHDIELYDRQSGRATVTLNEEKFLAERAELNADKQTEDLLTKLENNDQPVFDTKDYYNQEVMQITLDFLSLKSVAQKN